MLKQRWGAVGRDINARPRPVDKCLGMIDLKAVTADQLHREWLKGRPPLKSAKRSVKSFCCHDSIIPRIRLASKYSRVSSASSKRRDLFEIIAQRHIELLVNREPFIIDPTCWCRGFYLADGFNCGVAGFDDVFEFT